MAVQQIQQNDIINLFNYKNKRLRTFIDKNNNVWFSGKDCATILEYKDTKQVIRNNVEDEDKITFYTLLRLNGGGGYKYTPTKHRLSSHINKQSRCK